MRTIKAILAEVLSLFVDDGSLALALVVWCAGCKFACNIDPLRGVFRVQF